MWLWEVVLLILHHALSYIERPLTETSKTTCKKKWMECRCGRSFFLPAQHSNSNPHALSNGEKYLWKNLKSTKTITPSMWAWAWEDLRLWYPSSPMVSIFSCGIDFLLWYRYLDHALSYTASKQPPWRHLKLPKRWMWASVWEVLLLSVHQYKKFACALTWKKMLSMENI